MDAYFAGVKSWADVQHEHGGAVACAGIYSDLFTHAQQHNGLASWQCVLGALHDNGYGGAKQDYALAAQWWQRAADQGHKRAQASLGFCYAHGEGVKMDKSRAVQLYQLAADQGLAIAQYNLGLCYRDGTGVAVNSAKATTLFRASSDQGHEHAKQVYSTGNYFITVCTHISTI